LGWRWPQWRSWIFYLWDSPVAVEFIVGSAVGLIGATAMRPPVQRWNWLGYLAGLVLIFGLYLWIVRPLVGRYSLFAGFDGSNPAVLLPGLLTLAGCALGFTFYMLIALPRAAAE
jgi:hypothetical protein